VRKAKDGDRVEVHYQGQLDCGRVFADSKESGPIEFIIGEDTVLSDMGAAMIGMQSGEQKSVSLAAERAFGPVRQELVRHVERTFFRKQELSLGGSVYLKSQNNETQYRITEVTGSRVTLDANHPLAGQNVTFAIRLNRIF
jgi:peptidylprolyl isomerase